MKQIQIIILTNSARSNNTVQIVMDMFICVMQPRQKCMIIYLLY